MIGPRGQLNIVRNPECTACPLHTTKGNVCVMGRGYPRARVMLIGEAPGQAEAETGKPFMGRAGKLLDELIEEAGLRSYYITNIARCRPPGNKTPTDDERRTCSRLYLFPEVRIVQPVLIVTLGNTSGKFFLPNTFHRGDIQQTWFAGSMRNVLPTWHPSAYLHSGAGKIKKDIVKHLIMAKTFVKEQGNERV